MNFDRTSAALRRRDDAGRAFDAEPTEASLAALEAAEQALGEAFADDTPHNDRDRAVQVVTYPAGLAWLRRLVENY